MQQFQHVNPVALRRPQQHRRGKSTGVLLTPGLLGPAFGGDVHHHHHSSYNHAPHSSQYYDFKQKFSSKNPQLNPPRQQHGFVPNVLYMLVTSLNVDWASVARRVRSHPAEAHVRDRYGRTVLHHAARRFRPSQRTTFSSGEDADAGAREYRGAVGALLAANPGAAAARNDAGETPLLVACGAAGMIESQSPSGNGGSCLAEVLKMLLVHNPHTVRMADGRGECPLSALWGGYRGAFEKTMPLKAAEGGDVVAFVVSCLENGGGEREGDGSESNESTADVPRADRAAIEAARPLARAFWRQATLLLQARYQWTKMHRSPVFRPVHAAAEAACCCASATPVKNVRKSVSRARASSTLDEVGDSGAIAILRVAALLHPDQLTRGDGRGRTPLLVAISGTAPPKDSPKQPRKKRVVVAPCPFENLEDHPSLTDADRSTKAESLKIKEAAKAAPPAPANASAMAAVDALLLANPRAASMPDSTGRLPLFHLIENLAAFDRHVHPEECRSLWRLVKTAPEALRVRDAKTRLYPFMLSAAGGEANVTYELLRALPEVVQGCVLGR